MTTMITGWFDQLDNALHAAEAVADSGIERQRIELRSLAQQRIAQETDTTIESGQYLTSDPNTIQPADSSTQLRVHVEGEQVESVQMILRNQGARDIQTLLDDQQSPIDQVQPEAETAATDTTWQHSSKLGTTAGTVSGAVAGAAIGSTGGPLGTVIGGLAGAAAGAALGAMGDVAGKSNQDPDAEHDLGFERMESTLRSHYESRFNAEGYTYEHFAPAYRYGYNLGRDERYGPAEWESIEREVQLQWERYNPGTWERYGPAIHFAWSRTRERTV